MAAKFYTSEELRQKFHYVVMFTYKRAEYLDAKTEKRWFATKREAWDFVKRLADRSRQAVVPAGYSPAAQPLCNVTVVHDDTQVYDWVRPSMRESTFGWVRTSRDWADIPA